MKLADFMTKEAFELCELHTRIKGLIVQANTMLTDAKHLTKEKKKDIIFQRNRLCEIEPKLVKLLLELA